MLIVQLSWEEAAADKVPIVMEQEPSLEISPDFRACSRCRTFISSQHREKQLLGTRSEGREPVASVIHSDGHSLAWLDRQYCSTAVQQRTDPRAQQSPGCVLPLAFLPGLAASFDRH